MKRLPAFFIALFLTSSAAGCAPRLHYINTPAVTEAKDDKASPVPAKTAVKKPALYYQGAKAKGRSLDVNTLDQIPASAWFTPRLGNRDIKPEEWVKGPEEKGNPQPPLTVVKTNESLPGFIVKDSRGILYLIQLERPDSPAAENTSSFVVSRLLWAFGYNIFENQIVPLAPKDFSADKNIPQADIDKVLKLAAAGKDGNYRVLASRFLDGIVLGPAPSKGTRKDDPNDTIPHQNRRTLRGLYLFSDWLDTGRLNVLDIYKGEPGQGHIVHYLDDSGTKGPLWLGQASPEFEFKSSRESRPEDDYWAAKTLYALKPEHLEALFKAAGVPDKETKAITVLLMKRREKIMQYVFARVSPLEIVSLSAQGLILKDLGREAGLPADEYRVKYYDGTGQQIAPDRTLSLKEPFQLPVSRALEGGRGRAMLEVTVVRNGKPAPRSAQYHLRGSGEDPKLAGVVH